MKVLPYKSNKDHYQDFYGLVLRPQVIYKIEHSNILFHLKHYQLPWNGELLKKISFFPIHLLRSLITINVHFCIRNFFHIGMCIYSISARFETQELRLPRENAS